MKKLLLLLLLFGFNANGAELDGRGNPKEPTISKTGLEGIAKDGLKIRVVDYSSRDKTFDAKAIENQVELRLSLAGIPLKQDIVTNFFVNAQVQAGTELVSIRIYAKRFFNFESNGKRYLCMATVWTDGGVGPKDKLKEIINYNIDKFLKDYLKANPKAILSGGKRTNK